jgi:hypothetical protein
MNAGFADNRIKLREGATGWQQVDGETILLDLTASSYLGVNRSGTLLWSALAEGTTRDELIRHLTNTFDIAEDQAGADVDAFLEDCRTRDLLA